MNGLQDGDYISWNLADKSKTIKSGDVALAVKWFVKETGELPTAIRLNPRTAHLGDERPRGISLELFGTPPWAIRLRYRSNAHA